MYYCNNIYKIPKTRPGVGEDATAEERDEREDANLLYRDGSEEGGG
jgi:hypothetical protein